MADNRSKSKPVAQESPDYRQLPAAPEVENLVLGLLLANFEAHRDSLADLTEHDFTGTPCRRTFEALRYLADSGQHIDRVTVAQRLSTLGLLESVGGLSWMLSLDSNLPDLPNIKSYVRVLQEKTQRREIIRSLTVAIDRAYLGLDTAAEISAQAGDRLREIAAPTVDGVDGDGSHTAKQIVEDFPGGIDAFLDPSSRKRGLPTGFARFDEMTGGLHDGELIVLAARPSQGKTAWALNVISHLCLHPKLNRCVHLFSMEMSGESILTRMLCATARVDLHKFRAGFLNAEERRKLQVSLYALTEARFSISEESLDVDQLISIIRRKVRDEGLHLAVIDYLGLLNIDTRAENMNQAISRITRKLKLAAQELQIPFMLLSQLSRAPEKRAGSARPILSDLRDGGSIENDADLVAFIFRESIYRSDRQDLKNKAELILAKQRNGPIGTIDLMWFGHLTRFEDPADPHDTLPDDPPPLYS